MISKAYPNPVIPVPVTGIHTIGRSKTTRFSVGLNGIDSCDRHRNDGTSNGGQFNKVEMKSRLSARLSSLLLVGRHAIARLKAKAERVGVNMLKKLNTPTGSNCAFCLFSPASPQGGGGQKWTALGILP